MATAAWRSTCGRTATAAGATWPDSTRTRAGTTVAAARFANCWVVEDLKSSLPDSVRVILKLLVDTFTALEAQITALDAEINRRSKSDPTARRLMTIPGVGPIASTAITALVPAAEGFSAGRDFAAWLGLTPLQKSTGGKQKPLVVPAPSRRLLRHTLLPLTLTSSRPWSAYAAEAGVL